MQILHLFVIGNKFSEVDAEKVTPCLKEEVLATIKTEILGSADVMPLNYAEFSITVSLISQSWLVSNSSTYCSLLYNFLVFCKKYLY